MALATARSKSLSQSSGNTCIGNSQPNASTFMTESSIHASPSPTGTAASMVKEASAALRRISSSANCLNVSPVAQAGASCASRMPDSVSRLAKMAIAATPRVSTFKAAVTAKVRSKIFSEKALRLAWLMTFSSGRANAARSSSASLGALSWATRTA